MATCRECNEEVEQLVAVRVEGKKKRVCPECAERLAQEEHVAEESEQVIRQMMGFRGTRS